jgi:sugar/nucleoside kinase (ribokinase family)
MNEMLFIGGSSVDIILKIPRFPHPDEKLVVDYIGHQAGGFIANTACAAAKLGASTAWAGVLGQDENGALMIKSFQEYGVDTSPARIDPYVTTDFTVIMVDPSGERTILVVPTSPAPPKLDAKFFAALEDTKIVYTQPQPLEWFTPIADAVHAGGGVMAVDVEANTLVKGKQLEEILRKSDIVFCNRRGLEAYTDTGGLEQGTQMILELGPAFVCVTLGKNGAYLATRDKEYRVPGYKVPVVDTTGAGDCFHAAFLYGYLNNQPLDEVLHFANAAAALSVQELGPRAGIPNRGQVESFIKAQNSKV